MIPSLIIFVLLGANKHSAHVRWRRWWRLFSSSSAIYKYIWDAIILHITIRALVRHEISNMWVRRAHTHTPTITCLIVCGVHRSISIWCRNDIYSRSGTSTNAQRWKLHFSHIFPSLFLVRFFVRVKYIKLAWFVLTHRHRQRPSERRRRRERRFHLFFFLVCWACAAVAAFAVCALLGTIFLYLFLWFGAWCGGRCIFIFALYLTSTHSTLDSTPLFLSISTYFPAWYESHFVFAVFLFSVYLPLASSTSSSTGHC